MAVKAASSPNAVFYTLGCKLNQVETETIACAFQKSGFKVFFRDDNNIIDMFDIVVLNTCAVTSKAEQKARVLIRKLLRENPNAKIIITGCYASLSKEKILSLCETEHDKSRLLVEPDKDSILNNEHNLLNIANTAPDNKSGGGAESRCASAYPLAPLTPHSRPFIKIQDGCNNNCAFCTVHIARGKSRSIDSHTILKNIQALENQDYAEAVLTGVNICQYNDVTYNSLSKLLSYILTNTKNIALRLGSLEINSLLHTENGELFFEILKNARIRPHFHLSLQSLDNQILQKMNRFYTVSDVFMFIEKLRNIKNDPFIGADIITGFPGETPSSFQKTFDALEKLDLAWIHAFPFSSRPGTAAAAMKPRISEQESTRNAARLTELAKSGKAAYESRWKGKTCTAVVLDKNTGKSGIIYALTENYIETALPWSKNSPPPPPGRAIEVVCSGNGH
jgi:threonylcarbamoyladenosine tRNA methylthiotransferase MtaB